MYKNNNFKHSRFSLFSLLQHIFFYCMFNCVEPFESLFHLAIFHLQFFSLPLSLLIILSQLQLVFFLQVHQEFCQHLNRFNALLLRVCLFFAHRYSRLVHNVSAWLSLTYGGLYTILFLKRLLFLHHCYEKQFTLREMQENKDTTLSIRTRFKWSKRKCRQTQIDHTLTGE